MRSKPLNIFLLTVVLILPSLYAFGRDNSTVLYKKAERIAVSGNMDAAVSAFEKVIRTNPYYALGHYGLGKVYLYRQGQLKESIRHLETAVDCDRNLAKGYFYLGIAYMLDRRYNRAATAFSTAYNLEKTMYEALFNLAIVYDIINRPHLSKRHYEKYLLEKRKRELDILF